MSLSIQGNFVCTSVNDEMYVDPVSATKLRQELTDIRDKAQCLIQRLEKTAKVAGGTELDRRSDGG